MSETSVQNSAVGTLDAQRADDVPAVLAACHARLLEREGIAMFVAIDDMRPGRTFTAQEEQVVTEGQRAADLLDDYYAGLAAVGFPEQFPDEEDHTGARELIDALVVLSEAHLRARTDLEATGE